MLQEMNATYDIDAVDTLFQRGAAAGYDGVILYDTNLEALGSSHLRSDYLPNLRQVIASAQQHKLEVVPQIYSFGHSMGMVFYDIELAEPTPARKKYVVSADRKILKLDEPIKAPLLNGNFSVHQGDKLSDWQKQEGPGTRTFVDGTGTRHPGGESLRIESNGDSSGHSARDRHGNTARLMQSFSVEPNSSVTVSCFVKGEALDLHSVDLRMQINFDGMSNCNRWMGTKVGGSLCKGDPDRRNCSFDWRQVEVTCDAIEAHTSLQLWLGLWHNSSQPGRAWFSDCKLRGPSGMSNILRRQGAGLTVRSADHASTVYAEGADFDPIPSTPQSALTTNGQFPQHGEVVDVTLPSTTGMKAGERVMVDYFYVPPGQVAACLTSDKSEQYLHDSARRHAAIFGEGAQYLVRYS
jgi:hypothetical protein